MMVRFCYVLIFVFFRLTEGQRRIRFSHNVTVAKRYMVYLTQAKRHYDFWICGGAIISRFHILTSAACVEDVQDLYAISGTRDYIPPQNIYRDPCSKHTKRKIVYTCLPIEYNLVYDKIKNWSYNDIAIVRVDVQYDFTDPLYDKHCHYRPKSIPINFDLANENKGRNVIILGYGHLNFWREPSATEDYNYGTLRYTTSVISDRAKCKSAYNKPNLSYNIDKYMICTNGTGNIDIDGQIQRRKASDENNNFMSRRQGGNCQNDHGGPLVSWIDDEETVMGVASVFRVNKENKCVGPYLHTSTARNKVFIECLLEETYIRRSNVLCNQAASDLGFKIVRRYVTWSEDDTEIMDNAEIKIRKQINMNFIGMG